MSSTYRAEAKLTAPVPLPEFDLPTLCGESVTSKHLERGITILAFHRYAACPLCASKLAEYLVRHAEIGDARYLPIFHSPLDKLKRFIPDYETYPFDVLSDLGREVYAKFGVAESTFGLLHPGYVRAKFETKEFNEGRGAKHYDVTVKTLPASFLIRDGMVVAAHYGRHWADMWTVDDAKRAISDLEA